MILEATKSTRVTTACLTKHIFIYNCFRTLPGKFRYQKSTINQGAVIILVYFHIFPYSCAKFCIFYRLKTLPSPLTYILALLDNVNEL